MTLTKKAWQEHPLGANPQDLAAGSSLQAKSRGTNEEPGSLQVTEAIPDTISHFKKEGTHQGGKSHQVSHHNGEKTLTEVNLDVAMLNSPSGEEHVVPSQSSLLTPEYSNSRTSGLRRSKKNQER